ncbi:Large subunit GTPase 1-like [Oopsacas minuta]|uniref:Large subunit GTPase 1 homolog n=1 Tax=Oopsacas minuta TaxID=111878 RepID=A0AAV7JYG3_9METZ|nr:Large subunit GTPase 1-like [Oopsacas minuta]
MRNSKSNAHSHLGRTLVSLKDSQRRSTSRHPRCFNSITEQNSLQSFLLTSQLADRNFKGEKEPVEMISADSDYHNDQTLNIDNMKNRVKDCYITIPRRVYYDINLSIEELSRKESYDFLLWKDTITEFEKNHRIVIPFEKNLEVWKQLWRVIEKSDILVQVIDARDPLLFRSCDLENYVKEINPSKRNFLLVNKSELLTNQQRHLWSVYFTSLGIDYSFWSANEGHFPSSLTNTDLATKSNLMDEELLNKISTHSNSNSSLEQECLENDSNDLRLEICDTDPLPIRDQNYSSGPNSRIDGSIITVTTLLECKDDLRSVYTCENRDFSSSNNTPSYMTKQFGDSNTVSCVDSSRILNSQEVISYLNKFRKSDNFITTIGMVGFPNVGKSSTINALIGKKVLATSTTPGKTKHFQSHFLDANTILCDCPGLVFPNHKVTNAQLICSGVLPVDQMKEYTMPMENICKLVPKIILEHHYNLTLESEPSMPNLCSVESLLTCFAESRNYVLSHGHPDFHKAAKSILKDFIRGNIRFAIGPPSIPLHQFNEELIYSAIQSQSHQVATINRYSDNYADTLNIDKEFFTGSVNLESTNKFKESTQNVLVMSTNKRTYSKKHYNHMKKRYPN